MLSTLQRQTPPGGERGGRNPRDTEARGGESVAAGGERGRHAEPPRDRRQRNILGRETSPVPAAAGARDSLTARERRDRRLDDGDEEVERRRTRHGGYNDGESDRLPAGARRASRPAHHQRDGARFFLRAATDAVIAATQQHRDERHPKAINGRRGFDPNTADVYTATRHAGFSVAESAVTEGQSVQKTTTITSTTTTGTSCVEWAQRQPAYSGDFINGQRRVSVGTSQSSLTSLRTDIVRPLPSWYGIASQQVIDRLQGQGPPPGLVPDARQQPVFSYSYEGDLARWIKSNRAGRLEQLLHIDVFDFDNCLFKSPVPDKKAWTPDLVGFLMSTSGRWFQDVRTLSEPYVLTRKEGFIADTADLVRSSNGNSRALTVLLTGRMGVEYRQRIHELLALTDLRFDLVCLKEYPTRPDGTLSNVLQTTMDYKIQFLETLLQRLPGVKTMAIWDDRPRHAERFGRWLGSKQRTGRLHDAVSHAVQPRIGYLPYDLERELVHRLVEEHNDRSRRAPPPPRKKRAAARGDREETREIDLITKDVHFTGVLLDLPSVRLLLDRFPPHDDAWRVTADHVTLCPGCASPEDIELAGGLGREYSLQVTHVGHAPGRVLAVRVRSAPGSPPLVTKATHPHVTIAYNAAAGARPKESDSIAEWKPVNLPRILTGVLGFRPVTGMQWR